MVEDTVLVTGLVRAMENAYASSSTAVQIVTNVQRITFLLRSLNKPLPKKPFSCRSGAIGAIAPAPLLAIPADQKVAMFVAKATTGTTRMAVWM